MNEWVTPALNLLFSCRDVERVLDFKGRPLWYVHPLVSRLPSQLLELWIPKFNPKCPSETLQPDVLQPLYGLKPKVSNIVLKRKTGTMRFDTVVMTHRLDTILPCTRVGSFNLYLVGRGLDPSYWIRIYRIFPKTMNRTLRLNVRLFTVVLLPKNTTKRN